MPSCRPLAACVLLTACVLLAACSTAETTPTPSASPTPAATIPATPSPLPTPRFTNAPDPALSALIPDTVDGISIQKPPVSEYAMTPGDVGGAFGDLGRRFAALVIAYVPPRRLTLLALRVDGQPVTTADLQPHLASAAEYVGIAGLHPEAWKAVVVGGHSVWTRGSDAATLPTTTLYCWSSGQYVFLVIGTTDALNRALVAALPGEAAPTPTPTSSASVGSTGAPTGPAATATPLAGSSATGG
jgi:hypothetical protein